MYDESVRELHQVRAGINLRIDSDLVRVHVRALVAAINAYSTPENDTWDPRHGLVREVDVTTRRHATYIGGAVKNLQRVKEERVRRAHTHRVQGFTLSGPSMATNGSQRQRS